MLSENVIQIIPKDFRTSAWNNIYNPILSDFQNI